MTPFARKVATPLLLAALLLTPALASAAASEDKKPEKESEDTTKAGRASLADKIAPVSGNLWFKQGRFEITPNIGFSLGDAFFQKYAFGMKLTYHLLESFGIGVHGSYALATPGGSVSVCKSDGCSSPTLDDLKEVPGKVSLLVGLDLSYSPFYGKVNVLAEKVLHFDTSIVAGIDLVQYMAPGGDSTMTVGGHVGLGERFFITPSVVLRLELRDYLYSGKTVLKDDQGQLMNKVENQLMFDIGVSFFIGGTKD
jgi:outer membrane beta-barrel protein